MPPTCGSLRTEALVKPMSVSPVETTANTRNSEARDWLQDHWQEVFASVPKGTVWAVVSRDGKHVLFYGDDSEQLRQKSASLGEPNPVLVLVPDFPDFLCGPLSGNFV